MTRRILTAVACMLAALALCVPCLVAFGDNAEEVAPGSNAAFPIVLPADAAEGSNVFVATIEYDPDVWEDPADSDFACENPWMSPVFNPVNHKLAVICAGSSEPGQRICMLTLTARNDAKPGETSVGVVNAETSAGTADVPASPSTKAAYIADAGGGGGDAVGTGNGADNTENNDEGIDPSVATTGKWSQVVSGQGTGTGNNDDGSAGNGSATPASDYVVVPASSLGNTTGVSGTQLAKTGDGAPVTSALVTAIALAAFAIVAISRAIGRRKTPRGAATLVVALVLAAGLAGAGLTAGIANAAEYDAQKDMNGDGRIDLEDVRIVEQILVGLRPAAEVADLNNDRTITATDLSILVSSVDSFEDPSAGNKPSEPENPEQPATPDNPTQPGEGDEGNNPTQPGEGDNNDNPLQPGEGDNPSQPGDEQITIPDTTFEGLTFQQIEPTDDPAVYEPLIYQSSLMKPYGTTGAGSQWPVSLETSASGDLMLYGIDVAGMYKSTDHGKTWVRANSGIDARGVGMSAIDPRNESHVLTLGLGLQRTVGGIYISNDGAETWEQTFAIPTEGARYLWDGLEFDPTSFDASLGICTDAYFSVPYDRDSEKRANPTSKPASNSKLSASQVGLYKTSDGGRTFELLVNDRMLADGIVRITDGGRVFVGNQHGLFRLNSDGTFDAYEAFANDGDTDFAKGVTGLDVVGNTVYVQTWDGIYSLEGESVTLLTGEGYKSENWPQFLSVSKSNPRRMLYTWRSDVNNYYVTRTHVSEDGGQTWQEASFATNSGFYKASWNGREKSFVIDPSNDRRVVTFGSDSLVVSDDGGKSFIQANGISNMMLGGRLNFNTYSPDIFLMAAQDYGGAYTLDGGATFEPVENLGKGNMYGGFAADRYTFLGFAGKTWGTGSLTVSHDGGATWTDTGLELPKGAGFSAMQSPSDPDVLFAGDNRSTDRGYTWEKMENCISVHAFDYTGLRELYGENSDGNVVVSYDDGATWQNVTTDKISGRPSKPAEDVLDMSLDQVNRWLYVLLNLTSTNGNTDQALVRLDLKTGAATELKVPLDRSIGWTALKAVEVDPNSTGVVYACMSGGYFSAPTALVRSVDHGATWSVLTTSNKAEYPANAANQGGYEVSDLAIDPYTGNLYASGGCYGQWIVKPPYDQSQLRHQKPQGHTVKYVYDGKVVHEATVGNNERHSYNLAVDGVGFLGWYLDEECTRPFPNGSFVYDSKVLYAKTTASHKVTLESEGRTFRTIDADKYDAGDAMLMPAREGHTFAGWFADQSLQQPFDFAAVTGPATAYAGWYKVEKDVFDPAAKDTYNYIAYADHKVQDMVLAENGEFVNNRSLLLNVEKNSHYCITFKMSTRFRVGMRPSTIWPYNPVTTCYIDPKDLNNNDPVDEYVIKTIATGDNIRMMVTYFNYKCGVPYEDIKGTFSIYKIESDVPIL